jgi:cell division protein FtsB
MKTQSIKMKIVSLLILLLLFSILTMGFIAYYTNNVIQNQSMDQVTNAKVEQVKKMIEDRESNLEITIEALNKNLIMTAKMIENKIRYVEADANRITDFN